MSRQTYPVACECGVTHQVTGGQAGSSLPCGCGKPVEVPTLGVLKRSVGETSVSADWEIEHRLRDRSLPEERECVVCGVVTRDQLKVQVVCERSEVKSNFKWWYWLFLPLAIRFLIIAMFVNRREVTHGRDVSFGLPVRVCEGCRPDVRSVTDARDLLQRTPLYARLLAKYPHAEVSRPG